MPFWVVTQSAQPMEQLRGRMGVEFFSYLTLAEYCTVLAIYCVSFKFIARILYAICRQTKHLLKNEREQLSLLLLTNLVCWAILIASALPHVSWMIGNWRPGVRWINAQSMYWTTIVTECMMVVVPYSLFFLTLDRTFAVQWLTAYQERHQRMLLVPCVVVLLALFAANFVAFYQIMPLPEMTDCNVFACLMTNGNTVFLLTKLVGDVLIICTGTYFLAVLRKRTASVSAVAAFKLTKETSKFKPDILVVLMLVTELLVNFVPQLVIFTVQRIINRQIATELGPINHFLNALDALVTMAIYRHTLRRIFLAEERRSSLNAAAQKSAQATPQPPLAQANA